MATSLDDLLQADRQKRKNQDLANKLLGSGRRSSTPSSNGIRKPGQASLASRISGTKRFTPVAPRSHIGNRGSKASGSQRISASPFSRNSRPIRDNPMARKAQNERMTESIVKMDLDSDTNGQINVVNGEGEISIRGAAGPYTVVGSNFAPGTTAADIESAMAPVGGPMEDCKIVKQKPTVVAEMVFLDKAKAENVIATFNEKRADGRLLRLHLKVGKASSPLKSPSHDSPHIDLTRTDPPRKEAPRAEPPHNAPSQPKAARAELNYEENSYASQREQSERNRRRAQPEFQDGSYGFEQKEERMDVDNDDRRDYYHDRNRSYGRGRDGGGLRDDRRLYSDDLYPRHRGRGFR